MTPQVSDFIPGLLGDKDKYIEVADRNLDTLKKKGQGHKIMCGDNGYTFITKLHTVLLTPDQ